MGEVIVFGRSRVEPALGAKPAALEDLLPTPDGVDHSLAVEQLAAAGILTDVDLFFADPHTIPPHPSISPSALDALQSSIRANIAPGITGATLLQHAIYPYDGQAPLQGLERPRLSTSLSGLDALLSGGWEAGDMIEVSGGRRSGKTLLVLYCILSHLLHKTDERVLFIDTAGLFDADRCWDILKFLLGGTDDGEWETRADNALGRVQVAKCFEAGAVLKIIEEDVKKEVEGGVVLSMIVVDSVTKLLDVESPFDHKRKGTSLMLDFMGQLSSITKHGSSRITTFLVNNAVPIPSSHFPPPSSRFPTNERLHPALGLAFAACIDINIWMTRAEIIWGVEEEGKVVLEVTRNARGVAGGWIGIQTDGIQMVQL